MKAYSKVVKDKPHSGQKTDPKIMQTSKTRTKNKTSLLLLVEDTNTTHEQE
jgi:hypothetical protein